MLLGGLEDQGLSASLLDVVSEPFEDAGFRVGTRAGVNSRRERVPLPSRDVLGTLYVLTETSWELCAGNGW